MQSSDLCGSLVRPWTSIGTRIAGVSVATFLAGTFALGMGTLAAQASTSPGPLYVRVDGLLGSVSTSPLSLTPTFDLAITDYVLRCQAGTNAEQLTLTASSGGTITVRRISYATLTLAESLVENQALVIDYHSLANPVGTRYWIRCLPHDFPQLAVTQRTNPAPGWYLTGNINSKNGSGTYAMVLDSHGTPVWYRQGATPGIINVTLLNNGTLAWKNFPVGPGFGWDPNGAYEDYNIQTQQTTWIKAPVPPMDLHELHPMANGDLMVLSTPLLAGVDLSPISLPSNSTIVDCVVQEMDPLGNLVWEWRASDHLNVTESVKPALNTVNAQSVYDIFHCNSVDTNATSQLVLVSMRETDALFMIDKTTSKVVWKLGGTPSNRDNAKILTITGDPDGAFHGQHDARIQPGGEISLYDDQSWNSAVAARGVEYHLDLAAGTATLVWSFASPDGHNSPATGSFRRLLNGNDNIICWGAKPNTLFTEVDASGNVLLNVTFPNGELAYRVEKVGHNALNLRLMRATAGLPPALPPASPATGGSGSLSLP